MQPGGNFVVAAGHPCLAGHFPGNPVVPGVVLLDEAFARLAAEGCGTLMLLAAKFTAPVRPGDVVELRWQQGDNRVEFACSVCGGGVLRGSARPA